MTVLRGALGRDFPLRLDQDYGPKVHHNRSLGLHLEVDSGDLGVPVTRDKGTSKDPIGITVRTSGQGRCQVLQERRRRATDTRVEGVLEGRSSPEVIPTIDCC